MANMATGRSSRPRIVFGMRLLVFCLLLLILREQPCAI